MIIGACALSEDLTKTNKITMSSFQYKILTSKNEFELSEEISEFIEKGWKLQGGVSLSGYGYNNRETLFAQAMINDKD